MLNKQNQILAVVFIIVSCFTIPVLTVRTLNLKQENKTLENTIQEQTKVIKSDSTLKYDICRNLADISNEHCQVVGIFRMNNQSVHKVLRVCEKHP